MIRTNNSIISIGNNCTDTARLWFQRLIILLRVKPASLSSLTYYSLSLNDQCLISYDRYHCQPSLPRPNCTIKHPLSLMDRWWIIKWFVCAVQEDISFLIQFQFNSIYSIKNTSNFENVCIELESLCTQFLLQFACNGQFYNNDYWWRMYNTKTANKHYRPLILWFTVELLLCLVCWGKS